MYEHSQPAWFASFYANDVLGFAAGCLPKGETDFIVRPSRYIAGPTLAAQSCRSRRLLIQHRTVTKAAIRASRSIFDG